MSQSTIERPIVPSPVPALVSHRTVTVLVRGQRVTVDDPDWCVLGDHHAPVNSLEDLIHEGEPFSINVPTLDGVAPALVTRMTSWPFARTEADRLPYLAIDIAGGDGGDLQRRTAVDELLDGLDQYTARLRSECSQLAAV